MAGDLLIRAVRPGGGPLTDLAVRSGRVAATGPALAAWNGVSVLDGRGRIALPGLVDAHAHLDKTTWGRPYRPHSADPGLAGLTENERRHRGSLGPVAVRAEALLARCVALGTTYVRSHVDVDTDQGLAAVEGVAAARAALAGSVDVQIVAFPQSGLLVRPGTVELLDAAVGAGADHVGGIDPAGFDNEPVRHLDAVFDIAARRSCGVDVHLHDRGELGAWEIDLVVERTRALGLAGRVTVSHAFALCTVDDLRAGRLVDALAEAGVGVTTVAPGTGAMLPLGRLAAAGVPVGLGNDGVRDLWSPYGNGDMVERAMLLAWRQGARRDEDVAAAADVATYGGARVLGLAGYGLAVGCVADVVLLPGATVADAVVSRPVDRAVVKRGVLVAGG